MKCEHCIALRNDSGYEHDATEWWCAVGEEEIEFADGSIGCKRRSIQKLKRDIEIQNKIEQEAFAKECGDFVDWVDNLKHSFMEMRYMKIEKPWENFFCDTCIHCYQEDMCSAYRLGMSHAYCPHVRNCEKYVEKRNIEVNHD